MSVNRYVATTISVASIGIALGGCASQPVYQCDPNIQETTPTSRFDIDRTYGVAFDNHTKLTWKLCAEGQSYSHGHCTGDAALFAWDEAMQKFENRGDIWRLPNVDELKSIVEERCKSPAVNIAVFPHTPPAPFWSASTVDTDPALASYVSFLNGRSDSAGKTARQNVRLVRGEDPKVAEERQEMLEELIHQNRVDELLKQEKDAEQNARVSCNSKARCDRLFSLTQTYIAAEASKKIRIATDKIIETHEPASVGDIGMSAIMIPGKDNSAEVRLTVSCMIFGSDILINNLNIETEAAESLKSKMKNSKISCMSKKISIYRDFRSFVDDKYSD
jgi:hypothetical protein